jgi:hypothetical protein
MLTEHFQIVDRTELRAREFNRIMYVLATPASPAALRIKRSISPV